MAARRLLIVMLVLLGISSVIAVVVPEPEKDDPAPQETAVTGETGSTGTTGEADEPAGDEAVDDPGTPGTVTKSVELGKAEAVEIEAKSGSRMILIVNSKDGSLVEVEGLGLTGFADPYAPAVFDMILPPDAGRYQVRAPGEKPDAVITTG